MAPPEVVPPKISLYRYATGQMDVQAVRKAMGLSSSPNNKRPGQRKIKAAQFFTPDSMVQKTKKAANAVFQQSEKTDAASSKRKGEDQSKGNPASGQTPATHTFTAGEDARLLEWKAANEGKPWKPLAEEMGKSESALKNRFKEIKNTDTAAQATGKPAEQAKKAQNGAKEEKKKESEKKQGPKLEGKDDEMLRGLIMKDDEDKWLRIASRFFDATGRPIHPEDLKDKYKKT